MASRRESPRSTRRKRLNSPTNTSIKCVWAEQIEPFYFSLYSVIFHRTILFFLKGYSNSSLIRKRRKSPIMQKKPAIQRVLNTPTGKSLVLQAFLKRIIKALTEASYQRLGQFLVRMGGFEPPRFPRQILSLLCMPFHHIRVCFFATGLLYAIPCFRVKNVNPCDERASMLRKNYPRLALPARIP